jgi:hypothetical protein
MNLRDRIHQALEYATVLDRSDAHPVASDALDQVFRCLKRDGRFAALSHDEFDLLTGDARARIAGDLGDLLHESISIDEFARVLDLALGD